MSNICKICHESTDTASNPLISPCDCRGSVKYVHRDCLKGWVDSNNYRQVYDSVGVHGVAVNELCPECKAEYTKRCIYSGVLNADLNRIIKNYNIFYIKYYKIPLIILCILVLINSWIYEFVKPVFATPLSFYSLTLFLVTKYITFFIISYIFMIIDKNRYQEVNLASAIFINIYNIYYRYYHYEMSSELWCYTILELYVLFALFNFAVSILNYYQMYHTNILYTNKTN